MPLLVAGIVLLAGCDWSQYRVRQRQHRPRPLRHGVHRRLGRRPAPGVVGGRADQLAHAAGGGRRHRLRRRLRHGVLVGHRLLPVLRTAVDGTCLCPQPRRRHRALGRGRTEVGEHLLRRQPVDRPRRPSSPGRSCSSALAGRPASRTALTGWFRRSRSTPRRVHWARRRVATGSPTATQSSPRTEASPVRRPSRVVGRDGPDGRHRRRAIRFLVHAGTVGRRRTDPRVPARYAGARCGPRVRRRKGRGARHVPDPLRHQPRRRHRNVACRAAHRR